MLADYSSPGYSCNRHTEHTEVDIARISGYRSYPKYAKSSTYFF